MTEVVEQARAARRQPTVSVVMAVYNGARYLRQAVDSILSQTWTDLEFVIVNDGSTDETAEILATCDDQRIVRVNNERNLGLTHSLNRGIAVSRGELIARQDADDWSLAQRLESQVSYIHAHPDVALVGCGSRWIDGEDTFVRDWRPPTDTGEIHAYLLWSVPFLHGTFVLRRACLADLPNAYNEDVPVAQDCDLLLRLSDRWDLANVSEVMYVHREHADTVTARRGAEQLAYLRGARQAAIERRLRYINARLGLARSSVPEWVKAASRRWWAQRCVWWSQGARAISRPLAVRLLIRGFLLDPITPELWRYVAGVFARKAGGLISTE